MVRADSVRHSDSVCKYVNVNGRAPGVRRAQGGNVWGRLPVPHVMFCLGAYLRLSVAVVSSSVRLVVACVRSPHRY